MKKILFAVTTDLNYDQRMQRICTSLAQNGYQVTLIGREWPVSKPLLPQPYAQHRLKCLFNKGKLFYLEYNLRLFFYLLFKPADAYGAADLDAAVPVCLKARLANRPFVFDAHEYFPEVPEVVSRPAVKKIWQQVEKFVIPRAALRYTVTRSLAQLFEKQYGFTFGVVRNISVLKPWKPAVKKPCYLLYQGAVNAGRGLEMLLEVMPEIDAELWICGQGDVLEDLKARATALNLPGKVKFLGYVLPPALEQLTREAYLGINLLENRGLSYYYSLSNKFFDYLHAGIPQVVINFPEYALLNREFEVGVTIPLETTALKTALKTLLTDEKRYARLVQNCLAARQHWNWQEEEKQLLALYETLWKTPLKP